MTQRSTEQRNTLAAVGYLRKSTKGKRADGRERQEKSISQQRSEIKKLSHRLGYEIVTWYADEGISGWKTGHHRPCYDQLLNDAERQGDVSAVFVDNLDRLSRATPFKVAADLNRLAEAGVVDIFCANGDRYHIRDEHNYGEVFRIVAVLMGNAEYSRQLGRRVAIAHRNNAQKGKRNGGFAPYGMRRVGGSLEPGPREEVQVVRWVFDWFVNDLCSANEIAGRLNRKGLPASNGGRWSRQTILDILDRESYAGTFTWNVRSKGQFWYTENGEVKDASDRQKTRGNGIIRRSNAFEGIITRSLWEKAARRRGLNAQKQRKPRSTTASLTRVLVCGHCGNFLDSFQKRGHTYYRCTSAGRYGKDACQYFSIAESKLLPVVMTVLAEEVNKIVQLSQPPEAAVPTTPIASTSQPTGQRKRLADEIRKLERRIEAGAKRLLECSDCIRSALDAQLTKLVRQKDLLLTRLRTGEMCEDAEQTLFADDVTELANWWTTFVGGTREAGGTGSVQLAINTSFSEGADTKRSPDNWYASSAINEALHLLGVLIHLSWRREEPAGKRARNVLLPMRFRMGQVQETSVPSWLASVAKSCSAERAPGHMRPSLAVSR